MAYVKLDNMCASVLRQEAIEELADMCGESVDNLKRHLSKTLVERVLFLNRLCLEDLRSFGRLLRRHGYPSVYASTISRKKLIGNINSILEPRAPVYQCIYAQQLAESMLRATLKLPEDVQIMTGKPFKDGYTRFTFSGTRFYANVYQFDARHSPMQRVKGVDYLSAFSINTERQVLRASTSDSDEYAIEIKLASLDGNSCTLAIHDSTKSHLFCVVETPRVEQIYEQTWKRFEVKKPKWASIDDMFQSLIRKIKRGSISSGLQERFSNPELILGDERIQLRCPLTLRRLVHPGKSRFCQHRNCFDMETFLCGVLGVKRELNCPICRVTFTVADLYIDPFIALMLDTVHMDDVAVLDRNGNIIPETARNTCAMAIS